MDWVNWIFQKFRMPPVNQVILIIILSDFIVTFGGSLIAPLFSLFIVQDIHAAVTVVGFATAIFWIVKSILQFPVARLLDRDHGEIDDYYAMLAGFAIVTIATFLFFFARTEWHIYALQFLNAVGNALLVPPFLAVFSRHIDRDQEAFEWALRSSFSTGVGSAIGGALSGLLAVTMGIRPLFLINATLMLIGLITLIFLRPYIRPRVPKDIAQFYGEKKV